MEQNIAIQIKGLKKQYRLGEIGGGTLRADLESWWARVRKKEDPNTKIGQQPRLHGQTFMALNGIDLTIRQGEAIGIIGANGAGKSTMLKILSRITAPTEGTVDIYGRIASMLEVGTGFNREMTGRENIYMNGAILGMTRAEIDAKLEDIIEFSEIREFIDTPVKRYSSGMYVKLAFAVAAHLDAEIMIMDEVLAVGDMAFQKKCLDKMRAAAKEEGRTVLYVSHNMHTIRNLCDRCVVLDEGRVIFDGDTEEAISVYIRQSDAEFKMHYDYRDVKRPPRASLKMEMLECTLEGEEKRLIAAGESLGMTLRCRANRVAEQMWLRLIISDWSGNTIGTAHSFTSFGAAEGETVDVGLAFETAHLAPGIYRAAALLYERDENGNQIPVDHVSPAFCFRLTDGDEEGLLWRSQLWGSVCLHDIKLMFPRVSDGE